MGLINLQTNLKSLKFGKDRVHSGNSGQPYIQTPIPEGEAPILPNDDFILRGGLYAVRDTTEDVLRLSKYFNDLRNPSGLLFVAKQNLLSRTAVRTQASTGILNEGSYAPSNTLAQASVSAFGLHFNKQGINPIPGTPGSLTTYSDVVKVGNLIPVNQTPEALDNNRLVRLNYLTTNNLSNTLPSGEILNFGNNVLTYTGGPGSTLGVGNTSIKFADQRTIYETTTTNNLNQNNVLTYTNNELLNITKDPPLTESGESFLISKYNSTAKIGDFRKLLRNKAESNPIQFQNQIKLGIVPISPDYYKYNIEQRVNLGDPGNTKVKNLESYTAGKFEIGSVKYGAASGESYDKINALPIYQSKGPSQAKADPDSNAITNDLVKFRIGVYDLTKDNIPKNYIHFRAFLNSVSDQYDADWNPTQYIGRGEKFYTYGGFNRKVSLSWTVAAQSKVELIPMYKKLNYLASVCAPDYSSKGYMRGNIVTLTIGGYFYEQPGIITGFSYEMNDDNATWEIGIDDNGGEDSTVKELPHLIKVTGFNFIPIHTFVPRLQQLGFNNDGTLTNNPYGPERYVALYNGVNNNYESLINE